MSPHCRRGTHSYLLQTLLLLASSLSSVNMQAYASMCSGAGELASGVCPLPSQKTILQCLSKNAMHLLIPGQATANLIVKPRDVQC